MEKQLHTPKDDKLINRLSKKKYKAIEEVYEDALEELDKRLLQEEEESDKINPIEKFL